MLLKVHSAAVLGVQAQNIDIEVDLTAATGQHYHVVGLPDTAIKESGKRVKAAIRNCGYGFPQSGSITVNLAPADFKKEGSCYDLPIALALLGLMGAIEPEMLQDWMILGELSLDGKVRPIRGALPVAVSAKSTPFKKLLLPADNAREAAVVEGISVYSANSLKQVLRLLSNLDSEYVPVEVDRKRLFEDPDKYRLDFAEVKGQFAARRAVEVRSQKSGIRRADWPPWCR